MRQTHYYHWGHLDGLFVPKAEEINGQILMKLIVVRANLSEFDQNNIYSNFMVILLCIFTRPKIAMKFISKVFISSEKSKKKIIKRLWKQGANLQPGISIYKRAKLIKTEKI